MVIFTCMYSTLCKYGFYGSMYTYYCGCEKIASFEYWIIRALGQGSGSHHNLLFEIGSSRVTIFMTSYFKINSILWQVIFHN